MPIAFLRMSEIRSGKKTIFFSFFFSHTLSLSSYKNKHKKMKTELGTFLHASEADMVFKSTNEKIPYFNAPAFLENKQKIGKVDEIFGPINEVMFTVKPDQGIVATSWKVNDKVYISPDRLLPLTRFTNPRKPSGGKRGGRGGRGGGRGGRGRGRGRGGRGGRGRGRGRGRGGRGRGRGRRF